MGSFTSFYQRFRRGVGQGEPAGSYAPSLAIVFPISCAVLCHFVGLDFRWGVAFGSCSSGAYLFLSVVLKVRYRRENYRSGRWSRVERALSYDIEWGGASSRLDALASAGVGDFASARRLLLRPLEPRADEDRELCLCTKVVIASFEGRRERALLLCRELLELPFEPRGEQRERRTARRAGVVALARTLSGTADEVDYAELRLAASLEPALFWPCLYGVAVACCARDEAVLAKSLVSEAPDWPRSSVFSGIHARIERWEAPEELPESGPLVASL